ncbi:hypothetical protein ACFWXO_16435 [Kitasatospora sp. NPDC059088]|uniref:hypothetical protein n=1 Tax=Kitasatospora sp. NPDC059088 TaxID=3346722 RepID=UPI00369E4908
MELVLAQAADWDESEEPPVERPEVPTPKRRGRTAELYQVFGQELTLARLAQNPDCKVSYNTLVRRVKQDGMDPEEAATTPSRTR